MSINMNSKKIKAQFANETNPRVGLIVLSTDNMIEKDFSKVLSNKPIDLYVNRIKNYNPIPSVRNNRGLTFFFLYFFDSILNSHDD